MKNITTWKLIQSSLEKKIPVMLLYVVESIGSSPGRQGFFMAVNAKGEMEGSIGGGIMEHKFVELAKEQLQKKIAENISGDLRKQIHDKSAAKDQSGMICSGEQTILIQPVSIVWKKTIDELILSLQKNQSGNLTLSPGKIEFTNEKPTRNYHWKYNSDEDWLYVEKTGYKHQLTIVGGGHCSLAFSKLMREMDFYIRVYDDRKGLKTMESNKSAHEKHLVNDFSELKDKIIPGDDHFVVIMTFGYRTDDLALRALVGKEFYYVGLLGSKKKIRKMMEDYKNDNISADWLQRVHAPIGLSIKSQTPEEIAISIAAEIIREKNKDL